MSIHLATLLLMPMRLATLAEWQQLLLPKDKVVESGERLMDFQKRGLKSTTDFCFKYDQKKILVGGKKLALNYFQPGPLKVELRLGSKGQTRKKTRETLTVERVSWAR